MDPLHEELCYMSNDADLRYSVTTPATAGPHGAHDDFRNMLDDSAPTPLDGEGKWHVSQSHPLAYATNSVTKPTHKLGQSGTICEKSKSNRLWGNTFRIEIYEHSWKVWIIQGLVLLLVKFHFNDSSCVWSQFDPCFTNSNLNTKFSRIENSDIQTNNEKSLLVKFADWMWKRVGYMGKHPRDSCSFKK